jgi:hypothetical protein
VETSDRALWRNWRPPSKRRNVNMPIGYSGQGALRREQCDMITWSVLRQQLHNHISVTAESRAASETWLKMVYSMVSIPGLYSEDRWEEWVSHELRGDIFVS